MLITVGSRCFLVGFVGPVEARKGTMKALSVAMRHEIVFEYFRCRSVAQVARKLNVSCETVRKWISRHGNGAELVSAKKSGRRTLLNNDAAREAMDMLLSGQFSGAQEVANELQKLGKTSGTTPVHRTTLTRHAKAMAKSLGTLMKAVQSKPKKELSRDTKSRRLNFCAGSSFGILKHVYISVDGFLRASNMW